MNAEPRQRPVYAAVFGDSQETVLGNGPTFVARLNGIARRAFGQSPATATMPPASANAYWGIRASVANVTLGISTAITSATTTTITANGLAATADLYVHWTAWVTISGVRHYRTVTAYNSTTKGLTLESSLPSTPSGTVAVTPIDPRRLPPAVAAGFHGASPYGVLALYMPDNYYVPDSEYRGDLSANAYARLLPLPNVPASLTNADTVTLRVMAAQFPGCPGVQVRHLPNAAPDTNYFATEVTPLTSLWSGAELNSTAKALLNKTAAIKFAAGKPYAQGLVQSVTPAVATPACIVATRFEYAGAVGLVFDSYSAGGYKCSDVTDNHASMKDFFDAWPAYDFLVVCLGTNDFYSAGKTAAQYKADLSALLTKLAADTGCEAIILVGDPMRSSGTTAQDAEYDQQAGVFAELVDERSDLDLLAVNLRRAIEEVGVNRAEETVANYRGQWSSAAYAIGDVIFNGGTSNSDTTADFRYYQAIAAHSNQRPPNATYWKDLTFKNNNAYAAGDIVHYPGPGVGGLWRTPLATTSSTVNVPGVASGWHPVLRMLSDGVHETPRGQAMRAEILGSVLLGIHVSSDSLPLGEILD